MKRKIRRLLGGAVTTAMLAGSILSPAVIAAAAPADEAGQAQEAQQLPANEKAAKDGGGSYDHIVDAAHEAWRNYGWSVKNGTLAEGETAEIFSTASEWLYVQAGADAGNSMSNRALVYSRTAGDKIKNGRVKMTFMPTCDATDARMGILFRCTEQGDCMYFAYDPSQGWYLQRKAGNVSRSMVSSGVKTMANAGEEITAEVEFNENEISAWITYNGERIQCFDKNTEVAGANGSEIHAGKTGFMIGKYATSESAYIKNDVEMADFDDSSTFNGDYDWESDTWAAFDANATCEKVERDAKNYYELQVNTKRNVADAIVVPQQQKSTDYPVKPFKTGKIDTYFTDLGTADGGNSNFAIVYRYTDIDNCAWVGYDAEQGWYWQTRVDGKGSYKTAGDKVPAPEVGETTHVEVEFDGTDVVVTADGEVISDGWYTTPGSSGTLEENLNSLPAGVTGFLMRTGHVQIHDFVASSYDVDAGEDEIGIDPALLSTDVMDVTIDKQFPRIQKYTFKDTQDNDIMWAQPRGTNKIRINGTETEADLEKVTCDVSDTKAVYTIPVSVAGVEAVITAEISVDKNIVSFDVTDIETKSGNVEKLEFPEMLMASVTNQDTNARLAYAKIVNSTTQKGDYFVDIGRTFIQSSAEYKEYQGSYAFVSNDTFSAAIYSNSDFYSSAGKDLRATATPGVAQGEDEKAFTYMGLRSSAWEIERDGWNVDEKTGEKPSVQAIITRDANDTGDVDWQDGAIALREIMYNPYGADRVKDMVTIRISENMASGAAHPFLESIDGIKRVSLATDGLGQQLLLKGYASEGHDSGHPDYWNVGERMGGVEDLKKLLAAADDYGTDVGIHINASEMYADSEAFHDQNLILGTNSYGWDWVDESYTMDTMYDLTSGSRAERLGRLREALGEENLDFIYLDVWTADTWQTDEVSKQFIENGWRCANEWGYINEKDTTWTHWATDLDYGKPDGKGINSDIMRFIRNHQKDTWMANFPSYGGSMIYPLLGGENNFSFEGWQRAKNFKTFTNVTFNDNLPTKFLQHYVIMEWENDETKSVADGNTEKYIRLESEDGKDTIEVRRLDDGGREMLLNGAKILEGHVNMNGGIANGSSETYLIPWYWDANGNDLGDDGKKLYHWNRQGGESTWELPSDWNVDTVKVYKLTDTGKTDETEVAVSDGKLSLSAEKETAYVIYPGAVKEKTYEEMDWGEHTGIEDPNFTSQTLNAWEVKGDDDGSVQIVRKSDNYNPVLQVADNAAEVTLSQEITGLEAGKTYMLYGLVDNQSDRKAYLEVETTDGTASNYTERSVVRTYDGPNVHNTDNTNSYMQNMPVIFTMPDDSSKATLKIRVEAGEGTVQYDELRVVEISAETAEQWTGDTFVQDFENVVQGWYPFVPGDNVGNYARDLTIHLSERNGEYTQLGWNNRRLDDVISGDWSLKAHHPSQHGQGGLIYQTIPQTYRFKAGEEYTVTFKYETPVDDLYQFVIGQGEHKKGDDSTFIKVENIKQATNPVGTFTCTFTPDSDNWWIGINYNSELAPGYTNQVLTDEEYRMGVGDIVLDDLTIAKGAVEQETDKSELQALIQYAKAQQETEDYQYVVPAVKKLFEAKLAEAEAVNAKEDASQEEIDAAYDALLDMVQKLSYIGNSEELKVLVDVVKGMDLEGVYTAETVKVVQDALAAAEAVLANENALQEEIDAAKDALQSAVDQLERIPVDKSKLEKLVADAAEYENRIDEYTPATAEPFTAALEGARAVLADDGAVQEEVDSAYATLQNAIFGLREIPDKSRLEELIKEAEGLDLSGYTAQSVEEFRAALASAKLVMADPNAEEAEVTRAAEQLQAAMDGLEKTEEKGGTAVKTGDSTSAALYVILVMTAGMVIFVIRRRTGADHSRN